MQTNRLNGLIDRIRPNGKSRFKALTAFVEFFAEMLFFIPIVIARQFISLCLFFGVLVIIKNLVNLF